MLKPRFNLWIEKDGQVVISLWRVRLLEEIGARGSISAAAEAMQVPYRRAWERIHEMEKALGHALVETEVGGPGGGGACLSPEARGLIRRFKEFSSGFEEDVDRRFEASFGEGARKQA